MSNFHKKEVVMTPTEATILAGLVSSTILPFVIEWILQDSWSKLARFIVSILVSGVTGVLVAYGAGDLTFTDPSMITVVISVISVTQLQWNLLFKGKGLEEVIKPKR